MSRFARRTDLNAHSIVKAFEAAGATVLVLSGCRAGTPDLAVGVSGRTHLVEIKQDSILRAHQPSPEQVKFARGWRGAPVHLVRTPQQALELVASVRQAAILATLAAYALASQGRATASKGDPVAAIEHASESSHLVAQNSKGAAK